MMKKKKRFPVFYTVYVTILVLFFLALAVAVHILRGYLAEYESAQPQYEAQRIFDTYYASGDYTALLEAAEISVSPLETQAAVQRYLSEFTSGKTITYTSITTGLDSTIKYIVKADDVKFSSFTLEKSGNTTEKGFALYEADSFELYTAGTESITVTAPRGYTVYINGTALDSTYLTGTQTEDISCQYMPEGVSGVVFEEYHVDGLYYAPQSIQILSSDGRDCPIVQDEQGRCSTGILYSDALQEEYSEYVVAAAQALAKFMQNDGRFSDVGAYMDPGSELYVNIRTSETYFVIDHSSYDFEDVRTSEFYAYDENTFSCRVAFTHVLKRYGSQDYKDYIDMTFFLRRVGDKFLIYDRYNH